MQHALFDLQDVTQTKMALLLNEQMELSRQMQEIDWMESAVKEHTREHERNGDPAALVAGWSSLSALDLELANKRQAAINRSKSRNTIRSPLSGLGVCGRR